MGSILAFVIGLSWQSSVLPQITSLFNPSPASAYCSGVIMCGNYHYTCGSCSDGLSCNFGETCQSDGSLCPCGDLCYPEPGNYVTCTGSSQATCGASCTGGSCAAESACGWYSSVGPTPTPGPGGGGASCADPPPLNCGQECTTDASVCLPGMTCAHLAGQPAGTRHCQHNCCDFTGFTNQWLCDDSCTVDNDCLFGTDGWSCMQNPNNPANRYCTHRRCPNGCGLSITGLSDVTGVGSTQNFGISLSNVTHRPINRLTFSAVPDTAVTFGQEQINIPSGAWNYSINNTLTTNETGPVSIFVTAEYFDTHYYSQCTTSHVINVAPLNRSCSVNPSSTSGIENVSGRNFRISRQSMEAGKTPHGTGATARVVFGWSARPLLRAVSPN